MSSWDEEAGWDTTNIVHRYYCILCEDFFTLTPLAPTRCPKCFADARYILGPLPIKEIDINKLIARQKKKYGDKMRK